MIRNWDPTLIALATTFHGLAILSTVFRLWYRWHTARMWWEDAWALVALLADIMCLVTTWLEQPVPGASYPRFFTTGNWILSFAFPIVIWASRMSILVFMVRVTRPEGTLQRIAFAIGISFGIMWLGLTCQRIQVCLKNDCRITRAVGIAQTITDGIVDVLLTGLPVVFLRSVKLSRKRKVFILSMFSASMAINAMTIAQAVVLFKIVITSGTVVVSHVKYALSLIVSNLLVIIPWANRVLSKDETSLDDSQPQTSKIELSTVELPQEMSQSASQSIMTNSSNWSFRGPGQSRTSSIVTGTPQAGGV